MDVNKEQSLTMIASRAGLKEDEIAHCLEAINTDEIKLELKRTTSEAVADGAFGLPYLMIQHPEGQYESFFGSDRFEVIASRLGVDWCGPVPDPDEFVPMDMPPGHENKELLEKLEDIGAIKWDRDDLLNLRSPPQGPR